ncbi:MAG: bifunctional UDP-N-acetylglucosamine diphosphorylase/glucosamine-1-phosphate N-acetyltransferase GlmU [Hyphomicrobiaceae bacterium]
MTAPHVLSVVLAAGQGTRMKSHTPKPLHKLAGRSLLGHALALTTAAKHDRSVVIVGPNMETVRADAEAHRPDVETFLQPQQNGTGGAVLAARSVLQDHHGDVYVLFCDTPLLRATTLGRVADELNDGANVVVLGFEAKDPAGYGRLVQDDRGDLVAIREHRDASQIELGISLCNSGVMALRCPNLVNLLEQIGNGNAKGEYYLTDIVQIARDSGLSCRVVTCGEDELLGINDRIQLAEAEEQLQRRLRETAMRNGATLIAPGTVWFSHDTLLGRDVVVEPNVVFGPGVTIEDGALIRANSHIEGAHIGRGARVGPFARLRPGAHLGENVHIGNFVEVKNVAMGDGAKANHLSYIGDGSIGEKANIGAGTIFCNYDGFRKHRTSVGKGAFVGSNSSLVAPLNIGEGAFIGSGSVVTRDVPADALALERSDQVVREGWAAKFRRLMMRNQK